MAQGSWTCRPSPTCAARGGAARRSAAAEARASRGAPIRPMISEGRWKRLRTVPSAEGCHEKPHRGGRREEEHHGDTEDAREDEDSYLFSPCPISVSDLRVSVPPW